MSGLFRSYVEENVLSTFLANDALNLEPYSAA